MDLSEKDKFEWQYGNQSIADPSIAVCQGTQMGSSPCPSVSMVDSFLWNQPTNSQSLGFLHNGVLPPSLSHFPTDSAFIERAARFSCFNGGGSFAGIVDPFGRSEPLVPYSKIQESEINRTNSGSPINDSGEPEFSGGGQEERTNLGSASGDSSSKGLGAKKRKRINEDMELDQVEGARQLFDEMTKENIDAKQKGGEQNSSTMATVKHSGKQAKDGPDEPKEDYIHVRARRGQATNSHSLAERVRREKISERMKFLQDLVPGCSKVTGKAVMLDEIINYVQSLQRQVEFLSMKLATVNQRLDINVEGLLSKEFLQSRVGSSSTMGFSHEMIHPQLQSGPIQAAMSGATHLSDALRRAINAPLTIMNGYKENTPQMLTTWDDELHNALQMNFGGTNPPLNTQELNAKPRDGFPI